LGKRFCGRYVLFLHALLSTTQQYDDTLATSDEVNPISGSVMDAQFADAFADRSGITKIAERKTP
jgi:hypothetical protein